MISPVLDEPQVGTFISSLVVGDDIQQDVKDKLQLFLERLTESARLVVICNLIKCNPSDLLWKSFINMILIIC